MQVDATTQPPFGTLLAARCSVEGCGKTWRDGLTNQNRHPGDVDWRCAEHLDKQEKKDGERD